MWSCTFFDAQGRPSFQALQHRSAQPGHSVVFFAFDLLHLDGVDLREQPLEVRRARLARVVGKSGVLLSLALPGTPDHVIAAVRELGLEGIVAKRQGSRYVSGDKHHAWLKLKLELQQEFVVGGYRPGSGGVDSLVVGYYETGKLRFGSKVRAGFTPHLRREVSSRLTNLHIARCPFVDLPTGPTSRWGGGITPEQMGEFQWVTPIVVVQVRFVEWTAEGHLRHAAFLGMREDKPAGDVKREQPAR